MKLNKIAGLIGSGMVLLSAGAYAQSTSEETSGDKKGSAVFSPLNVSRGK
jgi:hemoglobin/transferrin/lactoferrin receptor protein